MTPTTPAKHARGFTLIELVVTLAIVMIVLTLVTVAITNIRRADLKASSGMLSSSMRYLYNLAVINNRPYRLVLDLDEGLFWGEELETDDPCARYLPEEGDEVADRKKERDEEQSADDEALEAGPSYQRTKDNLLSERKLPRGIEITGVITSHHRAAQHEGRVAIHFFPGGYAERAYIWLGEQEDPDTAAEPTVTLDLDGLMGRVTRVRDALDERDFLKESDG